MPSSFTENYQLSQWEATDQVQRADFNADNAKIDAAMKKLSFGNCHIEIGTYVGTGEYGEDHPTSVFFDLRPMMIFLDIRSSDMYNYVPQHFILFPGMDMLPCLGIDAKNFVTWNDDHVSWYFNGHNNGGPRFQLNEKDKTYYYLILGTSEE